MKITQNGLINFPDTRELLIKDVVNLINITESDEGHLADIASGLRTIASSLRLKADKLSNIFNEQKQS